MECRSDGAVPKFASRPYADMQACGGAPAPEAVLPTGRTKSLGTRPGVPSGLVGLVGRALMPNVV
jgi:hypothetical protein